MPSYDYLCAGCGAFTAIRPMRDSAEPAPCPDCGAAAPRAFLRAPSMSTLGAAGRAAHATNERSRHAPLTLDAHRDERAKRHRAGCACCAPKANGFKAESTATGAAPAKIFPGRRPWMISH